MLVMIWVPIVFSQPENKLQIPLDSIFVLLNQNNTSQKLFRIKVETARKNVSIVKSLRLPFVNIGISGRYIGRAQLIDRDFSHYETVDIPHFGNSFSVEASYLIFDGGSLSRLLDLEKLSVETSIVNDRKNQIDLKLITAGYYLDLCRFQNQQNVFMKNIEQTDKLIEMIRARHKEGMVLANDITRIELQRENLRIGLLEIENNMSICNDFLVTAVGLPKETIVAADTSVNRYVQYEISKCQLLDTAAKYRPELQVVSVQKKIAQEQLKLAKAARYPSVSVFAGNNLDGPILNEIPPINRNINNWCAGVGLNYELSNIYKAGKSIKKAQSVNNELSVENKIVQEQAALALHAANTRFTEAIEKVRMYDKSLQLAEENFKVIDNRYLSDMALITDMLDALTMKLNAQLQVVNARLDVTYTYFKLLRELGKDF